jgi:radical SAM superfamily enzyme YgiQ (UPF0313 family)
MKYDIILVSPPQNDPKGPHLAPFLLKSMLEKNGFKCKALDWNKYIYDLEKRKNLFLRNNLLFSNKKLFNKYLDSGLKEELISLVQKVKKYNPEWFGISIMSQRNIYTAIEILKLISQYLPNTKRVIGGFEPSFPRPTYSKTFAEHLKEEGLIHHYISGEGEQAIVNLLNGDITYPGIDNNNNKLLELNKLPLPNYNDIKDYKYQYFFTYSSRGCINRCGFCTENYFMKHHRSRNFELTISDMDKVYKDFDIGRFIFTDSLMNGNPKNFRTLLKSLNQRNYDISGMVFCSDWMEEEDYKLMNRAGLKYLNFGIETGSEKVRYEMGKKFTNETVLKAAKLTSKYGIVFSPMMIVGWPSETEKEFQETLDLVTKLSKFKNVRNLNPGATLRLSPINRAFKQFNLKIGKGGKWETEGNTYDIRVKRWFRLVEHCKSVGISVDAKWKDALTGKVKPDLPII